MQRYFLFLSLSIILPAILASSCQKHVSFINKYQKVPCNHEKPRDLLYQEYYDSIPVPLQQGDYYHSGP